MKNSFFFLIMMIMMGFCVSCSDKEENNPAPSETIIFDEGEYSGNALPGSVIETTDGGFLLAVKEHQELRLIKIGDDLGIKWKKLIADDIREVANIVQTSDGNYAMAASELINPGIGSLRAAAYKTDQNGDLIWRKVILDGHNQSFANSLYPASDGSLLFHVYFNEPEERLVIKMNSSGDSVGSFPIYAYFSESMTEYMPDRFLFKDNDLVVMCDTLGNKIWFDNLESYITHPNLLTESDGTILVCDNGWDYDSTMREYIDIRRYAGDGTHTSTAIDLGYEHEFPSAMTETPQGEKIICGLATDPGKSYWFLIKTSAEGKLLEKKIFESGTNQNTFRPFAIFWKNNEYICFGFGYNSEGKMGMIIRKGTL